MHRRIPLVLTLVAWLLATGAQWDLLQTFAWARMFAENARVLPLGAALARTFSPEGRCEVCGVVAAGKRAQDGAESDAPGGKLEGKVLLIFQPAPVVIVAAAGYGPWPRTELRFASTGRSAPPFPPPRRACTPPPDPCRASSGRTRSVSTLFVADEPGPRVACAATRNSLPTPCI